MFGNLLPSGAGGRCPSPTRGPRECPAGVRTLEAGWGEDLSGGRMGACLHLGSAKCMGWGPSSVWFCFLTWKREAVGQDPGWAWEGGRWVQHPAPNRLFKCRKPPETSSPRRTVGRDQVSASPRGPSRRAGLRLLPREQGTESVSHAFPRHPRTLKNPPTNPVVRCALIWSAALVWHPSRLRCPEPGTLAQPAPRGRPPAHAGSDLVPGLQPCGARGAPHGGGGAAAAPERCPLGRGRRFLLPVPAARAGLATTKTASRVAFLAARSQDPPGGRPLSAFRTATEDRAPAGRLPARQTPHTGLRRIRISAREAPCLAVVPARTQPDLSVWRPNFAFDIGAPHTSEVTRRWNPTAT
ncbi:uncharacterized protein [Manis javanica]|uniref:uncharacterized protein n=1 Tax=Manis javanica TaxID=9974 RepID=UPI003C6D47BF